MPLFNNVLVERLSLYVSLVAALMVSLWTALADEVFCDCCCPRSQSSRSCPTRAQASGRDVHGAALVRRPRLPELPRSSRELLPLPVNYNGYSDLWQVADDFRFTMAGGYVVEHPPASFLTSHAIAVIALGLPVPPRQVQFLRSYIREKHVTSVIVDESQTRYWAAALNRIATPHNVGGVLLYRVDDSRTVRRSPCRRGSRATPCAASAAPAHRPSAACR